MDKKTRMITIKVTESQKIAYDSDPALSKRVRTTVADMLKDVFPLAGALPADYELIPDYTVIDFSTIMREAEILTLVLSDPLKFLIMHDHSYALGERIAYGKTTHILVPEAAHIDGAHAFKRLDDAIRTAISNAPFGRPMNQLPAYRSMTPITRPFNVHPPFALLTESSLTLGLPSIVYVPSHPALKVSSAHPQYQIYRNGFDDLRDNLALEGITIEFLP